VYGMARGGLSACGTAHGVDQGVGVLEAKGVWVKLGEIENFSIIHLYVKSLIHEKNHGVSLDFPDSIQWEVKSMISMRACDRCFCWLGLRLPPPLAQPRSECLAS